MLKKLLMLLWLVSYLETSLSGKQPTLLEINRDSIHYSSEVHHHDTTDRPDPPPKNETARMARYIVYYSDWCALAHISRHGSTTGFPVARVYSTADGSTNHSTGTPYFYVSKMDAHINDLSADGRCSVTMSLAEGDYCHKESLDPEDPRCAQVILTGRFIFTEPDSPEWQAARLYLFERHPIMKSWPTSHNWQVGKLKIGSIQVADNFGGSAFPSVKEYFAADPFAH